MGGRFDAMIRWWRVGRASAEDSPDTLGHSGNGNGNSNGNGNGHSLTVVKEPPMAEVQKPIEPPWLAQLDREGIPRTLRYPTTTLGRLVDQAAERFGDVTALIYDRKQWSYRELLAEVNRMAGGLSRLGVRSGDRVVLRLPNCPEYVIGFFAVQKLGAVVVNGSPLMGADDWRSLVALTAPRVVIGLDLQASQIVGEAGHASPEHFVWVTLQSYQTLLRRLGYQFKLWQGRERSGGTAKHATLEKLMEEAPAKPPTVEPNPDAMAVLQPTSGTTGALKLAALSHRNLMANATHVSVWMEARDGQERILTALPMFHIYGLMTGLINPIFCAATIITQTRFEAATTLDVIQRDRPTVFPLVPAICDALSDEIEKQEPRPELTGLRICISGAAPLSRETAERFERLTGARVIEGYGLSESSPVTHANPISRPRYGSIGLPMPDTLCRVVDLESGMRDVPAGQAGELLICGPQVMSGYYANPQETQQALIHDEDGRVWLRTGDVVRMDEDGFFQILDRKKDMIIRSGMKVYPAKIERVLSMHEQVADVAVIGRPDPVHTETVTAAIVLKQFKSTAADREALIGELRALCRQHLAPYEVPSKFEFMAQIPRSVLGKALKKELRREGSGVGVQGSVDLLPKPEPRIAKPEQEAA